jgi:uncharacterized protein
MKTYAYLLLFVAIILVAHPTNAKDNPIVGSWEGKLDIPGRQLTIVFNISLDADSKLGATMDSPDQGTEGIPVSSAAFENGHIVLTSAAIGGEYKGELDEANNQIKGVWTQGGQSFPLDVKKRDASNAVKATAKATPKAKNEVALETKTGRLYGTLLFPKIVKSCPVVLFIPGSGPVDRDGNIAGMKNNSLKMLSAELLKNGIGTLRYDKRGVAKSAGAAIKEADLRFENFISDAEGWIQLLKKESCCTEIVIAGHSQGSLIGMILAQQGDVGKFISIAGAGQSVDKLIERQLAAQSTDLAAQAAVVMKKMVAGKVVKNVPSALNSLLRPSIQPFMRSWMKYDPAQEIGKLTVPTLIVQGSTDIQVGVDDAERLALAQPKAEKQIITGMNHVLKPADMDRQKNIKTYGQPELPLMLGLAEGIVEFIKK